LAGASMTSTPRTLRLYIEHTFDVKSLKLQGSTAVNEL
jgi:hypothetical protein